MIAGVGWTPGRSSPGRLSLRLALAALLLGGIALGLAEIALFVASGSEPLTVLVPFALIGVLYLGAGVLAWWRRPDGRVGALLWLCGFTVLTAAGGNIAVAPLEVVGAITSQLPIGVLLHLLLAFPSGRLPDRASRWLAVAGYGVTVLGTAPLYLFASAEGNPLSVVDRPDLVAAAKTVQSGLGFVLIVTCAAVLVRRLRRADPAQRRVLAAVAGYGTVSILFITVSAIVARALGIDPVARAAAQLAVLAGLPFAFLAGVLRGGYARTSELEELGAWLGSDEPARPGLREALRTTLGDSSLDLLFWLPDTARHVDAAGAEADLPPPGASRRAAEIVVGGRRVGAVVYDAVLLPDPEPVRSAGRIVALRVEQERLVAELRAGREALRESRARIVAAADDERRRIARDLHDGLQGRLVVLGLHAGTVAARPGLTPELRAQITTLRTEAEAAIAALRGMVHGIMPDLLVQRGLYAAVEELVDRMPISTRLTVADGGPALHSAVESAGYFTVAEALANAVKHSAASTVSVRLARGGGLLRIDVDDDGIGGAVLGPGRGLYGVADRLEALGGRLHVDSPPGGGTSLRAGLPCGS